MNKKKDKISKEFEKAIESGIFPGAVFLCALKEKIVFYEPFGMADIFENRSMRKNSIFDLASLTKALATTLAIVRLMEKKMLWPDTPISHILKEFQNTDKADITVDMLLRHSSGLPAHKNYYQEILKSDEKPKQCLNRLLLQEKPEYLPGKQQLYSDLGFMILARIIEHLSGMRLDHFVSEEIYHPLGIEDLFFIDLHSENRKNYKNDSRFVSTRYCTWRKKLLSGEVDDDNAFAVGGIDGHAGLFGDVKAVWMLCLEILRALQNNSPRVLIPGIMQQLVQKDKRLGSGFEKVAGFDTPSETGSSSGTFFSGSSIGHLGFTGTSFWIDPETDWIVILLTNRVHPDMNNEGIKTFRPLIHDLARQEIK
jgi:serine-type D-Ala-D-Ala carboxypeptidase